MRSDKLVTGLDHAPLIELFREHGTFFDSEAWCHARYINDELVGGYAWTNYTGIGGNVQMHFVGKNKHWMCRWGLYRAFTYCFDRLKVSVILGFLPESRVYARDVAIAVGFKQFGNEPIPGLRVWMVTMTRQDCRWLALPSRGRKWVQESATSQAV